MRILMVSDIYFPRVNGVSTSIQSFRHELETLGHSTTVLAPEYGRAGGPEDGIVRIPARVVPTAPEDRWMRRGDIQRFINRLPPGAWDLVHIHTPFPAHNAGLALARRLGVPAVATHHTLLEDDLFHYLPFLPKALLRRIARRRLRRQGNQVDAVIAPSVPLRDMLRSCGVHRPIEVIPTGLPDDRFRQGDGAAFRRRRGIDPDRPVMVHIGRIAFEKNIGFLLEVLDRVRRAVPEVLLLIAGEGPALDHLKKRAARLKLGDNLRFIGYLDRRTELPACYAAGNAFVFASRTETQGLVLLEAMAQGTPVVSTAVRGTRDILKPGCGALVAEDDVGDFSDKVITLLQNEGLRRQLADQARDYAATWSAPELAKKIEALYSQMIGQ